MTPSLLDLQVPEGGQLGAFGRRFEVRLLNVLDVLVE